MSIPRIFLFFIVISLLSTSAFAEEFTASGSALFKTCTCEPIQAWVTVQNTDFSINQISITPTGKYPSWVTVTPDRLILLPGETQTISQFIHPDCSKAGIYDIGLKLESGDNVKYLKQQISVDACTSPSQNNTVPPTNIKVNNGLLMQFLLFTSVGLTIIFVLVLLAIIFKASSKESPKTEETTKKVEVMPIVVQRKLRYPWEKYFKRKPGKIKPSEPVQKEINWLKIAMFVVFIIIAIVIVSAILWFMFQPTSVIAGNGTNKTVYVLNASKITGI
ncbi:MAG: hypothetical protein EPN86_04930 [Nanoarchaeota archaeon]|nr:MAG: hypothetical protein EPN86_04930 [Nanoarchaeota archaeon]